ncbi:hypothetical protein KM043_015515 [Ampulex compressa]|nr:hypothetical protein KM043_015515 [Ampulex compressa]
MEIDNFDGRPQNLKLAICFAPICQCPAEGPELSRTGRVQVMPTPFALKLRTAQVKESVELLNPKAHGSATYALTQKTEIYGDYGQSPA